MNLDSALAKHAEWKLKFRSAISKQESLDAAIIAKDNCCDFGKWLHGEGKTKYSGLTGFSDCVAKHATFHTEAGKVATAINAGKYNEAEAMLSAGTAYTASSNAVGTAIVRLKKEAKL
jgi:Chemoreceptor zinc-binding domain